jgi:hypothetical protein
VPVVWAEAPGPFTAGLVFRVGRADEKPTHGGITHLVEHLALPAARIPRVEFNGAVSNSVTSFWASGEPTDALALIESTVRALHELPDRIEQERGTLLTEAMRRGGSAIELAAALRFGPSGYGAVGYPEFGLRWLEREHASAWARTRFTRNNVALWMTAEPVDVALGLSAGSHVPAPDPVLLPEATFPCVYPHAYRGGVAIGLLMPRTPAGSMALTIALERARDRLRYELGLSYVVDMKWEPLNADVADVVLWCDCQEGREREAGRILRELIDDLVADGPSEQELQRDLAERARHLAEPANVVGLLYASAVDQLVGGGFDQPAELHQGLAEVTPEAAVEAIETGLETAVLLMADETWRPKGRWSTYPLYSEQRVQGRKHRPAGPRTVRGKHPVLYAEDEGLTWVDVDDNPITVRFSDVVVVERWPDGTHALLARDSCRLTVVPSAWRDGEALVKLIESRVPPDRFVSMNPKVDQRVAELADQLGNAVEGKLARELRRASVSLDFGEEPLEVLGGKLDGKLGLLIVTSRRLIFSFRGGQLLNTPLSALHSIQRRGRRRLGWESLVVKTNEETYAFTEASPRPRLDQFFGALQTAADEAGESLLAEQRPSWSQGLPTAAALLAFPLSWLPLLPLALFGDWSSQSWIAVRTVVMIVLSAGICAAGIGLGIAARRRAARTGIRSGAAAAGIALSCFGVLTWVSLALSSLSG